MEGGRSEGGGEEGEQGRKRMGGEMRVWSEVFWKHLNKGV